MKQKISAIDLFCGAGGLTRGLEKAGIKVMAGIDIDPACEYPITKNTGASFIEQSIDEIDGERLKKIWGKTKNRLLAGCAPCQPFSTYSQGKVVKKDSKWRLLYEFLRLVEEAEPELVTMENVPLLQKYPVFKRFTNKLKRLNYHLDYGVVNCADYGVPQTRHRLVLLASKFGPINLIKPTHTSDKYITVRQMVENLKPLNAGETDVNDRMHQASLLSEKNLERIRQSEPGGTWRDWDRSLVAECHKKKSGKTYPSVYGRMCWDEPAPTMTTQFYGFGNGRFGHPEQDRAISLREGAMFQSFPKGYQFVCPGGPLYVKHVGRLIGNAVPVKLGQAIGRSIIKNAKKYS